MNNFNLRIDGSIAFLRIDQPESKVNVLNTETMKELAEVIGKLSEGAYPEVKALAITSSKDGIFIAGADIKEIQHIKSTEEAIEKAEQGKKILQRLADLDILTVAVINGACLGGGFELALACDCRVASFSDTVKIGLPEVKLGVIPGFGGTQRLPRLTGLTNALSLILAGKIVSAKSASRYGIVDKLFPDDKLITDTVEFINEILDGKTKPDKKKKKLLQVFLENTPLGRMLVFSQAKKNVLKQTKGFYPAPIEAIEVLKRTYGGNLKKGFRIESEAFGRLAITDVSKNLIKVFYLLEKFKKFPWTPEDIKPKAVKKCGIVGAGIMGGGIAQLVSYKDILTRVKDIDHDALATALKVAKKLFEGALKKRKLKKHDVEYKFGLISPTLTYDGFKNADIVIEAVVEDLSIKKKVFEEMDKNTSPETYLASNTSALPIKEMANATSRPEKVAGMHFFNPVHRMPLVEVIKAEKTSDETLAAVVNFSRKLGKTVIVVKDVPGFLINRILLAYLNEAGFLAEEGMKIDVIDKIACKFGMPMGPITLIDEVGIDVGYKVAKILEDSYGERMKVCSVLEKVKSKGLLGKKAKLGFYDHKGRRKPNKDIYEIIGNASGDIPGEEEALKRMIYVMVNEAARCLEEGVVDLPETIDIGMVMGTGFPPLGRGF